MSERKKSIYRDNPLELKTHIMDKLTEQSEYNPILKHHVIKDILEEGIIHTLFSISSDSDLLTDPYIQQSITKLTDFLEVLSQLEIPRERTSAHTPTPISFIVNEIVISVLGALNYCINEAKEQNKKIKQSIEKHIFSQAEIRKNPILLNETLQLIIKLGLSSILENHPQLVFPHFVKQIRTNSLNDYDIKVIIEDIKRYRNIIKSLTELNKVLSNLSLIIANKEEEVPKIDIDYQPLI